MLLHIVNKSPETSDLLASCLRTAVPGAALLLIEDGVYAARSGSPTMARIVAGGLRCHALREDVAARGLDELLDARAELIDYAGFVRLCADCHAVQSWY